MPITITMPSLSPTMTDGTLAAWHKKPGEAVSAGDIIAEIETDKATMEVEAIDEGTLGKILVPAGTQAVTVGTPIALILVDGEDAGALEAIPAAVPVAPTPAPAQPTAKEPAPAAAPAAPAAKEIPPEDAPATQEPQMSPAPPSPPSAAPRTPAPKTPDSLGKRIPSSPVARHLARQAGLDLATVVGTGPGGRIIKADIERITSGDPSAPRLTLGTLTAGPPATEQPSISAQAHADAYGMIYSAEPLSSVRRTIARRLSESKATIPHFTVTVDCHLDALLEGRKALNDALEDGKLSVNDIVIKAAADVMAHYRQANAAWGGDAILQFEQVNVAVAVAAPGGLITPVIADADKKGLAQISQEMKALIELAKNGQLTPAQYETGTFSISNLGMFGVRDFTAIINPPQSCILAVGAGEKRPVVAEDGSVAVGTVMTCTLCADHRVIDGALAAQWLAAFKKRIQTPLLLAL
ncbi:MAG: pyruvate dehydrogenase complex dihydrolipoamide acetyltransferase [Pseudomonadota bacterium]